MNPAPSRNSVYHVYLGKEYGQLKNIIMISLKSIGQKEGAG
jgi:hypothetical protein